MTANYAQRQDLVTRSIHSLSRWFERIGLIAMVVMALATLVDVIGSKLLLWPLPGSTEITSILQVVAIAGGLAFSKIDGRHIRVEFLFDALPKKSQALLDVFSSFLGVGFFAITSWMCYINGIDLLDDGTHTFLLGIPLFPLAFWIALGCVPMCLALLLDLVASLGRILK